MSKFCYEVVQYLHFWKRNNFLLFSILSFKKIHTCNSHSCSRIKQSGPGVSGSVSSSSHNDHSQPAVDSTGSHLEENLAININFNSKQMQAEKTLPGSPTLMQEWEPGPRREAWGWYHNNHLSVAARTQSHTASNEGTTGPVELYQEQYFLQL